MNPNPIGISLADQFKRVWEQVRDAIAHCTDAEWRRSDLREFVPAGLACHLVETVEFYVAPSPDDFPWTACWGGANWETDDPETLPGRAVVLAHIDQLEPKVDAWLRGAPDEALLGENTFPWTGANPMERMIYTLRHSQHHLAEINEELTRRGLPPADWR
ncbi:MAG: DinB family protein [Anaerolineae bacterium]|nr:DinB family protein [Anaerolineae bacterium]